MKADPDSLTDLLRKAWQGRRMIALGACGGLIAGCLLFISLKPVYEATMIIAPRSQASEERSMNILSDGSASARGLSISSEIPREFIRFQQVLRENSVALQLSENSAFLDKIEEDTQFRFSVTNDVTKSDLSRYLKKKISLRPMGATSSLLVSYRHPDPSFAQEMLNKLHRVTDDMIREDANRQTIKKIEYLQGEIASNYNPDHRKVLTDLLMLEERNKMFIAMDQPFAADIVEPATASPEKIWPKAFIVIPVFMLLGSIIGFFWFYFRKTQRRS